jgi:hypothetical protein
LFAVFNSSSLLCVSEVTEDEEFAFEALEPPVEPLDPAVEPEEPAVEPEEASAAEEYSGSLDPDPESLPQPAKPQRSADAHAQDKIYKRPVNFIGTNIHSIVKIMFVTFLIRTSRFPRKELF